MASGYSKKSGTSPLGYLGSRSIAPPQFIYLDRAPTNNDYATFNVGALWLDTTTEYEWILAKKSANVATWVLLYQTGTGVLQIDGDTGTAVPTVLGVINVVGDATIETFAAGRQVSISLTNGTDGQLLIGSTAGSTAWANIPTTATVAVTNGANTLNIESLVAYTLDTLTADDLNTAVPTGAGVITLAGDVTNIHTTAAAAAVTVDLDDSPTIAGTLTISLLGAGVMQTDGSGLVTSTKGTDGQLLISSTAGAPAWANITSTGGTITIVNGANTINLETAGAGGAQTLTADDANTASPTAGGLITIAGDITNIHTAAGGDTLTITLDDSPTIAGTLTISTLTAGVMQTDGSGLATSTKGTDGQLLISSTAGAPAWAAITAGTNITVTNGSNTIAIDSSLTPPSGSESFVAYHSTNLIIGSGVKYYLGSLSILTEWSDLGANFYPGDGVGTKAEYVAPLDGIYYFTYNHGAYNGIPGPPVFDPPVYVAIETSNGDLYRDFRVNTLVSPYISVSQISITIELSAGDQVWFWSQIYYPNAALLATFMPAKVGGYLMAAT